MEELTDGWSLSFCAARASGISCTQSLVEIRNAAQAKFSQREKCPNECCIMSRHYGYNSCKWL